MSRAHLALAFLVVSSLGLACSLGNTSYLRDERCAPHCSSNDAAPIVDGAASGDASPMCPAGRGPSMLEVPASQLHPAFCIDTTEVTLAQYRIFMAAVTERSDPEGPSECAWNTSFEPVVTDGPPDRPVRGVDWCDADSFCRWAGKRLCGRIAGGPLDEAQGDNGAASEWYAACSHDGERVYPYGSSFDAGVCALKSEVPVSAGSLPTCAGGFAGLFDMSGNVYEWEDSCEAHSGASDTCRARGGSFADVAGRGPNSYTCGRISSLTTERNAHGYDVGFRCCASAPP